MTDNLIVCDANRVPTPDHRLLITKPIAAITRTFKGITRPTGTLFREEGLAHLPLQPDAP